MNRFNLILDAFNEEFGSRMAEMEKLRLQQNDIILNNGTIEQLKQNVLEIDKRMREVWPMLDLIFNNHDSLLGAYQRHCEMMKELGLPIEDANECESCEENFS